MTVWCVYSLESPHRLYGPCIASMLKCIYYNTVMRYTPIFISVVDFIIQVSPRSEKDDDKEIADNLDFETITHKLPVGSIFSHTIVGELVEFRVNKIYPTATLNSIFLWYMEPKLVLVSSHLNNLLFIFRLADEHVFRCLTLSLKSLSVTENLPAIQHSHLVADVVADTLYIRCSVSLNILLLLSHMLMTLLIFGSEKKNLLRGYKSVYAQLKRAWIIPAHKC